MGNPFLYLPDIFWEKYFKFLINDGKYEIDFFGDEWEEYENLLNKENMGSDWTFPAEVNRLKSSRKKVILLDCIRVDGCVIHEESGVFPNCALIPFYILYLQNSEFFTLFTKGDKKELKYGNNIIKYGNLIEDFCIKVKKKGEDDKADICPYFYEKLTGVNLALLVSNYYVDILEHFELPVYDLKNGKIREDKKWKNEEKENKRRLKKSLMRLLEKVMEFPNIFGRILWIEIVLSILCKEEMKYRQEFCNKEGIMYDENNVRVLNYILGRVESFMEVLESCKEKEKLTYMYPHQKILIMSNTTFVDIKEIYEICDEEATKRMRAENSGKDPWDYSELSEIRQWGKIKEHIAKIVAKEDEDTIIGCEDIGKYVKKSVKQYQDKIMPVIFIKDDIWNREKCKENHREEYKEDRNDFLVYALKLSK